MTIQAGLLPNVPMDLYIRDAFHGGPPSLSSSMAHLLLTRSPAHVKVSHARLNPEWQPDEAGRFDLGTAAHAVLLEGRRDLLAVCAFPDWRTKAAQLAREQARLAGQIPVLEEQAAAIEAMVDAAQAKLAASPDLASLGALMAERTILWQEGDAWCRCRPDWVARDHAVILSYKTTGNAEPDAFTRGPMVAHSYDVQAVFELTGLKAATGVDAHYVWLAQEIEAPYACSLVGLTPEFFEFARDKFREAVAIWTQCLAAGAWPDYPDRICYVDLPPWMQTRWMERQAAQRMTGAPQPIDDGREVSEQLMEIRNL